MKKMVGLSNLFWDSVDVLCSNFGNIFISDEHSGAIYSVGYGTIPK
jgi:hypothetical protein